MCAVLNMTSNIKSLKNLLQDIMSKIIIYDEIRYYIDFLTRLSIVGHREAGANSNDYGLEAGCQCIIIKY